MKMGQSKGVILFQSEFYLGGDGPALEFGLGKGYLSVVARLSLEAGFLAGQ
jgi:hypothetical protein